ncbi:ABC transporter ATP-binding protein [Clostridioides difficile]|uniref:ABC transporter, ATP-binding protein n=3 Tax=Clostridioides difficile TaxID=1496 RepID=D5Q0Q1_CLODI|nr:ABC transporter, ATP-binding protein [Clostridioides difficile NAP08]EFH16623.1 ABC transporter, ATP-binding protein [Clostridioides difficile NAP07]EII6768665.1 ATP-binding cassette domain-containing protein [Clostridioides difficile]EII6787052.1 ATP-binding cassette domain-containing protein [Clostridioides difficile]EIS9389041.1 ATP-binding cassette domain-containing protein [Clostridioides difficile]
MKHMEMIIRTQRLSKEYNKIFRVKDIDLRVPKGAVYGFLGPNGAGKSTTLKMLLGLAKPTQGNINILGKELNEKNRISILKDIGSLIESPSYYGHLTGLENMIIMQRLLDLPKKNINEALKIVRLENQKNKKVSQYSLGMKQRLGIAMAIMKLPKLLILDEPTNGLDPAGIEEIRELIKSLPEKYGMTVLISSHLLSEIDQIATSIGIINHGELVFQDIIKELHNRGQSQIAIKTNNIVSAQKLLNTKGYMSLIQDGYLTIENLKDSDVAKINNMLVHSNIDVFRIEEHKKSLEDIFLELTGKAVTL